jgi:UDP:flavonoid glycosyltransferase YjiC (YdhE family)
VRVSLSTYGSRGDVEPLVGLAVRLRALGAEVRVCAPPDEDFAQRLAGVGVPMVPVGQSARALATDPALDPWQETPDLDVVQTGAWILPDVRPLPDDLEAFLDAGTPPVYVGFGSMPMRASTDVARVAIEAIRAQGRRALVGRGWADLGIGTAHDGPAPTTEYLSAALGTAPTPETRARATAVTGTIRTDGATVAATLLGAVSREGPPVSA